MPVDQSSDDQLFLSAALECKNHQYVRNDAIFACKQYDGTYIGCHSISSYSYGSHTNSLCFVDFLFV